MPETEIKNREDQPGVIMLDPNLTIAEAATLKDTLKCYADSDQDVTLDGSQVESIDTISIQLLLAFVKHLETKDISATWLEPSASICQTAQVLGLEEKLGLHEFAA